jgi:hypothetical protein
MGMASSKVVVGVSGAQGGRAAAGGLLERDLPPWVARNTVDAAQHHVTGCCGPAADHCKLYPQPVRVGMLDDIAPERRTRHGFAFLSRHLVVRRHGDTLHSPGCQVDAHGADNLVCLRGDVLRAGRGAALIS